MPVLNPSQPHTHAHQHITPRLHTQKMLLPLLLLLTLLLLLLLLLQERRGAALAYQC